MHEIKTGPPRTTFWCGVLTAEKPASQPTQARTVRGVYTSSSVPGMHPERRPGRKKVPLPG